MVWPNEINATAPSNTASILHGDVSGGDQRGYLSITYVASSQLRTHFGPIRSFASACQSLDELIQRAGADEGICTPCPSCWAMNAGLRPDIGAHCRIGMTAVVWRLTSYLRFFQDWDPLAAQNRRSTPLCSAAGIWTLTLPAQIETACAGLIRVNLLSIVISRA